METTIEEFADQMKEAAKQPKPNPEAMKAEADAKATEAEAQQTLVRHADGSVSMLVPESLDSQVLVTRDAQGQLVVSHAGDAEVDHVEE